MLATHCRRWILSALPIREGAANAAPAERHCAGSMCLLPVSLIDCRRAKHAGRSCRHIGQPMNRVPCAAALVWCSHAGQCALTFTSQGRCFRARLLWGSGEAHKAQDRLGIVLLRHPLRLSSVLRRHSISITAYLCSSFQSLSKRRSPARPVALMESQLASLPASTPHSRCRTPVNSDQPRERVTRPRTRVLGFACGPHRSGQGDPCLGELPIFNRRKR